jgi:fatty acid synthase subunit alpha, fungi type/fatty acid synthase subunit beta, fungi type
LTIAILVTEKRTGWAKNSANNCREALGHHPLYKDGTSDFLLWVNKTITARGSSDIPTAPRLEVTPAGDIVYAEVVRENVRKLEACVEEMAMGGAMPSAVNIQKVQDDVLKLRKVVKSAAGD